MKTIRSAKFLGIVFALALLITACGGKSAEDALLEQILENSNGDIGNVDLNTDDGSFNLNVQGDDGENFSINSDGDGGTVTVEGEDGGTFSFGGGEVPEALQLPVPDGGDVQSSFTTETDVSVSLVYPQSDFDSLVEFYDTQLNPGSDDVNRSESSFTTEDGTFNTVLWAAADGSWTVNVGSCIGVSGNFGSTCVSIIQSS